MQFFILINGMKEEIKMQNKSMKFSILFLLSLLLTIFCIISYNTKTVEGDKLIRSSLNWKTKPKYVFEKNCIRVKLIDYMNKTIDNGSLIHENKLYTIIFSRNDELDNYGSTRLNRKNRIFVYDISSNKFIQQSEEEIGLWGIKEVLLDKILVSAKNNIFVYDKNSLKFLFKIPVRGSYLNISDNKIYVMYAISWHPEILDYYDLESGKELWSIHKLNNNINIQNILAITEVYGKTAVVLCGENSLSADQDNTELYFIMLDPENGKIILQQDLKINTIVDWCGGENAIFYGNEFYISARIPNNDVIISKYKIIESYEAKPIWVKKFGVKPVIVERDEYKEEGLISSIYLNNKFLYAVLSCSYREENNLPLPMKDTLYALDAKTGETVWKIEFNEKSSVSRVITSEDNENVFAIVWEQNNDDGVNHIFAINRKNGKIIWQKSFSGQKSIEYFKNLLWVNYVDAPVIEVYDAVNGYILYRINPFKLLNLKSGEKGETTASEIIPYEFNKTIFLYNNAIFNIKFDN